MKTSEYFGMSEFELSKPFPGWENKEEYLLYTNCELCIYMADTIEIAARQASNAIVRGAHDIQVLERMNGKYAVIVR